MYDSEMIEAHKTAVAIADENELFEQRLADIDRRRELCKMPATLNGKPAKISGLYDQSATVWVKLGDAAHYDWRFAEQVIAAGGNFTT